MDKRIRIPAILPFKAEPMKRKTKGQDEPIKTLYFAYGSNLWTHQMSARCPSSTIIGTAVLPSYRWVISCRGYANVVPSMPDECYGVVYSITDEDIEILDEYEGVPTYYQKEMLEVKMLDDERLLKTLVYVDLRLEEGTAGREYVGRINNGLRDAKGIPEEWVKKYVRPFIAEGPVRVVGDALRRFGI